MFGNHTLPSLLDEQTSALRTQLEGVLDGAADAVHESRVATRRIRELLALVPAVPGRDGEANVGTAYQMMGRALGKVRDIDVQIALICNLEAHAPQTAPSLVLVRQDHEQDRLAKMRRLIKTLERLDVDALLHQVGKGHPAGLRSRLTSTGWRQQLRRLVVERSRTAIDAIAHGTGVYFPNRAHRVRIAIKQLRYAAEIAQAIGFSEMQPAIRALKKGQDTLGHLHDRQVLADALTGYRKHQGVDPEHLTLTRQVLEGEVLNLHSRYLSGRGELRTGCADIERVALRTVRTSAALRVGTALAVSTAMYATAMSVGRGKNS
jgi:CHAD domain-containing protein